MRLLSGYFFHASLGFLQLLDLIMLWVVGDVYPVSKTRSFKFCLLLLFLDVLKLFPLLYILRER